MNYLGYQIKRVTYQGCRNYQVYLPNGSLMAGGIAPTLKVATKWIECDIAERRADARRINS